jgi:hypothetical protein
MVSNAYDADATEVHITVDLSNDVIEVSDDGNGMTPEDFEFFLRIAGQQRSRLFSSEFRRRRIGQFGIGFLAVFPFGKRIKVISTARKSDTRFEATIPADRYILDNRNTIDVEEIPVTGFQEANPSLIEKHGTTIRITGLSEDLTKRYFKPGKPGLSRKQSIRDWPSQRRLYWSLCEDLPLDYPKSAQYHTEFGNLGVSGLRVYLNGEELKRNAPGSHILESKSIEFNDAKCQYVIATDWKAIQPVENRYLKQRVRNVGIGDRTAFGLGLEGRTYSRLHWLTGEIQILEGFDELVSIDREKFIDSPSFDEYRDYFRRRLSYFALHVETIWEAKRDIDRQIKSSRFAKVGSKKELIDHDIEKLVEKGFEVVKKPRTGHRIERLPVSVDVKKRIVEVVEDHPAFLDRINIDDEEVPVRYVHWGMDKSSTPIRRASDGAMEVNLDYPLFRSGRYGDLFKKVFVVMVTSAEKTISTKALISEVARKLVKEFNDLK